MECTGEAPENATVTIQCNGTGLVFHDTTLVEYAKQHITGSVPVPLYEQCTITVVFSNGAGSSEPFILAFGKYSGSTSIQYKVNVHVLFITYSYRHYSSYQ